jgi:hypothetical protein
MVGGTRYLQAATRLTTIVEVRKGGSERLPSFWQIDSGGILEWHFQLRPTLIFKMAGIGRSPATTTRFSATTPLLGSHFRLARAG